MGLDEIDTPFLLLDPAKVSRNISRLRRRTSELGVGLRPHVKTAKSPDVAGLLFDGATGPITVSTLREAEVFGAEGFTDILYAVGIAPDKLARVLALYRRDVPVVVLLDTVEQARAVADASRQSGIAIRALIEIDCDGHRGGIAPEDPALPAIAATVADGARLLGVLAHAGESYFCYHEDALAAAAEGERAATVRAAEVLRANGFACPIVSVGSTPTAHAARDLTGVTEMRAGNFVFFDLVMAGIGVCSVDDIAVSVVATVIGHRRDRGWIITDSGWTALSADRSTARQPVDQGYGLASDVDGTVHPDLLVADVTQEHGILSLRAGSGAALPDLPVGTRVRILPNHACATAEQHDRYHVLGDDGAVCAVWPRVQGW
ncbi:alanine racemase [Actinophytocola sp.]|uniref:alanine racemase n=1 Tax=Actinophytocola sp. TaxID=1872138 RepID=UPI002EDA2E71